MRRFANLYDALDSTTSTLRKVDAMATYFREAPPADAAWALAILMGRRLKRVIPPSRLVEWTHELTELPPWLVEESYAAVGDLAETTALLLDRGRSEGGEDVSLSEWIEKRLLTLKDLPADAQRQQVTTWWSTLSRRELFLLNKLLTGEMRVGVSDTLVVRALASVVNLPATTVAHRLMGTWQPSAELFTELLAAEANSADASKPYPFFLASPLEEAPQTLGPRDEWLVEWKWDGIRGQLVRRGGESYLWSRGEELITHRFPEVVKVSGNLPDGTVLDGELLAFVDGKPLPFSTMQQRIGRQKLTPQVMKQAPVAFIAYDLLEHQKIDIREQPLSERRRRLAEIIQTLGPPFHLSEGITAGSWEELVELRTSSRERGVEGFMLKRLSSPYQTGRKRGDWWKWKIDPYAVDAVLIYAHPGNGRRANLFTDYTFALWDAGELVPVAKAYSGLTDVEIAEMDKWVRSHTVERFGPVRAVEQTQVFELHFEAIAPSSRHRSGVAVRFPRIARRRLDKKAEDADTLETLRGMMKHSAEKA